MATYYIHNLNVKKRVKKWDGVAYYFNNLDIIKTYIKIGGGVAYHFHNLDIIKTYIIGPICYIGPVFIC